MAKHYGSEETLKLLAAGQEVPLHEHIEKKWPRREVWPYQLGLGLHDLLMATFGMWLCHWLLGMPFGGGTVFLPMGVLLAVLTLSFFPVYDLYSYHLIFSQPRHRRAMAKALGWGALVLVVVTGQYAFDALHALFSIAVWPALGAGLLVLAWAIIFRRELLPHLLRGLGIGLIAIWVIDWSYQGKIVFESARIGTVPIGFLAGAGLVWAGRRFMLTTVYNRWLRLFYRLQVGIIGSNEEAREIAAMVIDHNAPFWVTGTIGGTDGLNTCVPKQCLGSIVDLPQLAQTHRLSDIIVTDEHLDKRTLISLLDFGLSHGLTIWFTPSLLPIIDRKIYIDKFCGIPMIKMCSQKRVVLFNRLKYAMDAMLALPLFVLLLPLFGAIALAIKINSPGPVFYRARAIGKNGQEFKMFKFRSMRVNNDAGIHKDYVTKLIKGEIGKPDGKGAGDEKKPLKITDDPRITMVGGILRKYSLDELPQLINVLLGQMSLIGPRPCLPYEFDVYQDWYKKRAAIRPGITGLWQVAGRSEVAFEEMILLDLYYLYNRSLWMDVNLLIETVFVVLKKKGAY